MGGLRLVGWLVVLVSLWLAVWSRGAGWPVVLTLALRAPPAPAGAPPPAGLWLRAAVPTSAPHLSGLAVGDAVQFDRYGVLPPTAGHVTCTPVLPYGGPLIITPLGGALHEGSRVHLSVVPAGAAECTGAARPESVLSGQP